jgi:HEAT repeat protein
VHVPALARLLDDDLDEVRNAAVYALERIDTAAAQEALGHYRAALAEIQD